MNCLQPESCLPWLILGPDSRVFCTGWTHSSKDGSSQAYNLGPPGAATSPSPRAVSTLALAWVSADLRLFQRMPGSRRQNLLWEQRTASSIHLSSQLVPCTRSWQKGLFYQNKINSYLPGTARESQVIELVCSFPNTILM